jgi:hypothetical protein
VCNIAVQMHLRDAMWRRQCSVVLDVRRERVARRPASAVSALRSGLEGQRGHRSATKLAVAPRASGTGVIAGLRRAICLFSC